MFMVMVTGTYLSTKLNDRQKELLKEFAEINGEDINEQSSNFKDRAKRFFKGE